MDLTKQIITRFPLAIITMMTAADRAMKLFFIIGLQFVICSQASLELTQAQHKRSALAEQVHISSTGVISEMMVTWSAFDDVQPSYVWYGVEGNLSQKAPAYSTKFVDGGSEKRTQFVFRAKLVGLTPSTNYTYQCGSDSAGWSEKFRFTTFPEGTDWSPNFIVYGDMGNENPQSLERLKSEVASGMCHAIIHNGDFAYDMDFDNARVGDGFMRKIEPMAASVPYMTSPGNHEFAYNFSNYKNRFTMPMFNETQNLWYSWNVGPVHFIMVSTEVYFFLKYGLYQIQNQLDWLLQDLKAANTPEARSERPWIITFGHRPPYCSDYGPKQCSLLYADTVRGAFEDIFYEYGVELSFWAHEHDYERLWPIYNNTVYNGSMEEPYTDPPAPVHIITGSAGCDEKHSTFGPKKPFDAFRSLDYGYTRLHVINKTQLELEQVSDDQGGKVIDRIRLIKTKHGMRRPLN